MTKTVTLDEATSQLGDLVDRASHGDVVIIDAAERGAVRLMPTPVGRECRAWIGTLSGKITIRDDFDEPLPDSFWTSDEP